MLKLLRVVGFLEGLSLLLLFFVAMPLKYAYGKPEMVRVAGMAHGLFFLAFLYTLTSYALEHRWGWKKILIGYACSSIPFGTMWFDHRYLGVKTK